MSTLLALSAGIFSVAFFPSLPDRRLVVCALLLALIVFVLQYRYRQRLCRKTRNSWAAQLNLAVLAWFLLGMTYGLLYAYLLQTAQLPQTLDNQQFTVTGDIRGLPIASHQHTRFSLRIHRIQALDTSLDTAALQRLEGKALALSWYPTKDRPPAAIAPGQLWQLQVKLRRPRGFVNPAGFDYALFLLQHNIAASGYVTASGRNQLLQAAGCDWLRFDCWRYRISQQLQSASLSADSLGPFVALLVGDRQQIPTEQWQLLRDTGTVHLMAISGLHIGLAALGGLIFGRLCSRLGQYIFANSQRFLQFLPLLFSTVFGFIYALLAGLSLPTQRALLMLLVVHGFSVFYYRLKPLWVLTLTLLLIALIDPLAIWQAGFWLSFLAVALLLFCFSGYRATVPAKTTLKTTVIRHAISLIKAQWVVGLGLFLPGILLLQGVSVSGFLANAIAVPVVSLLIVPLLFLALVCLPFSNDAAYLVLAIADTLFHILLIVLNYLQQQLPGFWSFSFGQPSWLASALAAVGLLWLLTPKGFPAPWLGLLCCLPLFFPADHRPELRITFLEVGQGTSILVETSNHQLVYDVGRNFSERFDSGEHIVAPYLLQLGYHRIDRLILSHGDSDHAGGAPGLQQLIRVDDVFSGEPHKTAGKQCLQGQQWFWDDVQFTVLWPSQAFLQRSNRHPKNANSNNFSCVLHIQYRGQSILLTGDIEKTVERQLPDTIGSVTLLLAPHHGSNTSSHRTFVQQLQAKYVVFTTAYYSPYGHPHPDVVKRYQQTQARLLHTGKEGALRFTFDRHHPNQANPWQLERWRLDYARYWYSTD